MTETRTSNSTYCQFAFSDGRRCRMLRRKDHPSLCLFHGHAEQQLLESHRLGAEMAASFTADVNHVLGKVFTALAQNRIPQRNAATLGYLGALMLHSLPMAKRETTFTYSYEAWKNMIDNAIHVSDSWPATPAIPESAATHK